MYMCIWSKRKTTPSILTVSEKWKQTFGSPFLWTPAVATCCLLLSSCGCTSDKHIHSMLFYSTSSEGRVPFGKEITLAHLICCHLTVSSAILLHLSEALEIRSASAWIDMLTWLLFYIIRNNRGQIAATHRLFSWIQAAPSPPRRWLQLACLPWTRDEHTHRFLYYAAS